MRYIANVIVDNNHKLDMDKAVKRCDTVHDVIPSLPTLIIGWHKARDIIKGFNILKKDYPEQNLYWTFSKTERRCDYDVDIVKFYDMAVHRTFDGVRYKYINLINVRYSEIKEFLSYIKGYICKTVLMDENFIYVYSKEKRKVYGVSLSLCEYIGIKKEKVTDMVKNNNFNTVIKNDKFLPVKLRRMMNNDRAFILPLYDFYGTKS